MTPEETADFISTWRRWEHDTQFFSSPQQIYGHPLFTELVQHGRKALPFLIQKLKDAPEVTPHLIELIRRISHGPEMKYLGSAGAMYRNAREKYIRWGEDLLSGWRTANFTAFLMRRMQNKESLRLFCERTGYTVTPYTSARLKPPADEADGIKAYFAEQFELWKELPDHVKNSPPEVPARRSLRVSQFNDADRTTSPRNPRVNPEAGSPQKDCLLMPSKEGMFEPLRRWMKMISLFSMNFILRFYLRLFPRRDSIDHMVEEFKKEFKKEFEDWDKVIKNDIRSAMNKRLPRRPTDQ